MIGITWSKEEGQCGACHGRAVTKRKQLRVFGIPFELGTPSVSCGCSSESPPAPNRGPRAAGLFCPQCGTPLDYYPDVQRWYCRRCQHTLDLTASAYA